MLVGVGSGLGSDGDTVGVVETVLAESVDQGWSRSGRRDDVERTRTRRGRSCTWITVWNGAVELAEVVVPWCAA